MNGKKLESLFKQSCEEQGCLFIRFRDAGFQGDKSDQRRFTIKNIADCVVFNNSLMSIIEIKHRNQSMAIKDLTQYKDIAKVNKFISENNVSNACCGVLMYFGSFDRCYFISIDGIDKIIQYTNKKSFNYKDCESLILSDPFLITKVYSIIPNGKRTERFDMSFLSKVNF